MSVFEAIVLGIVQGVTEFLPVSSSGHLIIVPWLLGWDEPGLAFDAALHLGTLFAVICYFWRDLLAMAFALPRALARPRATLLGTTNPEPPDPNARLALLIALGTIPGAIAGLAGESTIESFFHGDRHGDLPMAILALLLMALAALLLAAERVAAHVRPLRELTLRDAVVIGLAQAGALLPGVSRSGSTITAGLFRGLRRADAARFSFLLGIPLIAGAGAKGFLDVVQSGLTHSETIAFTTGMLASAISGFGAIWFLLRFLQRSSTAVFVFYRFGLGILVLVLVLTGVR